MEQCYVECTYYTLTNFFLYETKRYLLLFLNKVKIVGSILYENTRKSTYLNLHALCILIDDEIL